MIYPEQIITIDDFSEFSIKERGSVFNGQVYHCESEDEATKLLMNIKKKYYDATHHSYACKFTDGKFKYSDDGEPNSTAGIRILNAIDHFNLINVIVVVIRYFGGTKLGVGPLGKAYYTSAFNVLNKAVRLTKYQFEKVLIESEFSSISHVHRILTTEKAIIVNTEYKNLAIFECLVKSSEMQLVTKQLNDICKGEIKISRLNEQYYF